MPVDVTSEIGQLETVLVHTPGPELAGGDAREPRRLPLRRHHRPRDRPARAPAVRLGASAVRAACSRCASCSPRSWRSPAAREFLITKTMDVVASDELTQRLGTLPPAQIVEMLIEGTREETGPIAPGAQRGRLRLSAAAQPLLSSGHRHGARPARGGRLDALRRPLDRGAAHQGAVQLSSRARQRGPAVRRVGGAPEQLQPRGRATCTTSAPTCWWWASASGARPRRSTSCATRCSPRAP